MTELCDLCCSPELEPIYQPEGSTRGLDVYVCDNCGLAQSLPRLDRAPRAAAAVSSDADWGNVRYGKSFRTEACLAAIRTLANFTRPLTVLDVGSNRGSFARALLAAAPQAAITCVESDERIADSCAGLERATLIKSRIEQAVLPESGFDLIHSCHTIEHLASPKTTLLQHWRALKPGGVLVLDAPNIALIGGDDIVEEWFIDKHLYHFSSATLARLLEACGFKIMIWPDAADRENLLFAARKRGLARRPTQDSNEVDAALALMISYVTNRARNLAALTQVAAEIGSFRQKRVALWGAGRLFDALVKHGGFDPKLLALLVDTHLKAHVAKRYGVPVAGPEALAAANPHVVIVMSRTFSAEIAGAAKREAPNAEILTYGDLLARARAKLAA